MGIVVYEWIAEPSSLFRTTHLTHYFIELAFLFSALGIKPRASHARTWPRRGPAHLSSLAGWGFGEEIKLEIWGGEVEIGPHIGQTGLTIWPRVILNS